MADYTENYNLKKPSPEDFVDIADINSNMDLIDEALAECKEEAGAGAVYCTCTAASNEAAKVATVVRGKFKLEIGVAVDVKFTNTNITSSPTLNVNNTGAKYIKMYGTASVPNYIWQAGAMVHFVYDGTNWIMENTAQASTVYYGVTKLSTSVSSTLTSMAATPSAVKQAYDKAKAAIPKTEIGAANGVASLDTNGKVPMAQIPEGVALADHIHEVATTAKNGFMSKEQVAALDGKADKSYVDTAITECMPGCIIGDSAPTNNTYGTIGQFYIVNNEHEIALYQCVSIENENYLWSFIKRLGQLKTEIITASKTWTKPGQIISDMQILCVGAGGGSPSTGTGAYSGGGGGGYIEKTILPKETLKNLSTVSVTIGTGSTSNGGVTSFGSYLSASGGGAGAAGVKAGAGGNGGSGGSGGGGGHSIYAKGGNGGNGSFGGGGGGGGGGYTSTSHADHGRGGNGGTGGIYGGGGGGASPYSSSYSSYYGYGGAGGTYGGAGGDGKYNSPKAVGNPGTAGTNTIGMGLEFEGTGLGGTTASNMFTAGGGGGGYGGNGGNGGTTYASGSVDHDYGSGGGGGGGYGCDGGAGSNEGGGGGGGGYGDAGTKSLYGGGGGGGYGPSGYGRGAAAGSSATRGNNGVMILTYFYLEA